MTEVIDHTALLSGRSLTDTQGQGAFFTYSFPTSVPYYFHLSQAFAPTELSGLSPLTSAEQALARNAIAAWAEASGLVAFEVPAGLGDIQFMSFHPSLVWSVGNVGGFAFYPAGLLGSDVFINQLLAGAPNASDLIYDVLLHEVGHALGLKHPFEGEVTLAAALDNTDQTVMSYTSGSGPIARLGPLDVQAIQQLYGTNDRDGTQVASWNWDAAQHGLTQAGGDGNDTITGVGAGNTINGGAGDDTILVHGLTSVNVIDGSADDDRIEVFGGKGATTISGGEGNDDLTGISDRVSISAGDGDDFVYAEAGNDIEIVDGGAGDDTIAAATGKWFSIDGGAGEDLVVFLAPDTATSFSLSDGLAMAGNTLVNFETLSLQGGASDDNLVGAQVDTTIFGLGGRDTLQGGAGDDRIHGGDSHDLLNGGAGDDTLDGGEGNDFLDGGASTDAMSGGAGDDIYVIDENDDSVSEAAGGGLDTLRISSADYVAPAGVEVLHAMTDDAHRLIGNAEDNTIVGASGDDTIEGREGADRIEASGGADSLDGGDGNDLVIGGPGDDTIVTGIGFDTLLGQLGNDWLVIRPTAVGFASDKFMIDGGAEADTLSVELREAMSFSLRDELSAGWFVTDVETLRITAESDSEATIAGSDRAETITAQGGAQTLLGWAGGDLILGGAGNDSIDGGDDDDTLEGGAGDDTLLGGGSTDTAVFSGNRADYSVVRDGQNYRLVDRRSGSPDGTDLTIGIPQFRFADGTVLVADLPPNVAPVAAADSATTAEDASITIAVLTNDTDENSDTLLLGHASLPANGTATVNGDGTITYIPNADFAGQDRFTYTIADGKGGTANAMVDVTVTAVNDAPVADADGPYTATEDTELTISEANGVLAGDTDVDDGELTAQLVSTTKNGTLTLMADGSFTYAPGANFNGSDSFSYAATDAAGARSAPQTVTFVIAAVDDAPDAVDDSARMILNVPLTIRVLANDTDADGDALAITGVGATAHGAAVLNNDGTITYTPDTGHRGTDSFTYSVSDGADGNDTATVSLAAPLIPFAQTVLTPGQAYGVTGFPGLATEVFVTGTSAGAEFVTIGDYTTAAFSNNFANGGDTVRLAGQATAFAISVSGNQVILTSASDQTAVNLPVGFTAITLVFETAANVFNDSRMLRFVADGGDADALPDLLLGSQRIAPGEPPLDLVTFA